MLCKICTDMLQFQGNILNRERRHIKPCAISEDENQAPEVDNQLEAEHISKSQGNIRSQEILQPGEVEGNEEAYIDSSTRNLEDHGPNTPSATLPNYPEGENSKSTDDTFDNVLHFGHHQTPWSLINSAGVGCFICKTMLQDLTPSETEALRVTEWEPKRRSFTNPDDNSSYEEQEPGFYTHATINFSFDAGEYPLSIVSNLKPIGMINEDFDLRQVPAGNQEFCSYSTDYTGSENSLQTAIGWLQTCLRTHRSCNREGGIAPWFPTRLLYLGHPDVHAPYVKLIHTANKHPSGPYVTLSHRWGGSKFLQLEWSNMEALQDGISLETMTKTFQDAVYVSRRLDIRYLWIDSLCIVQDQDDRSDWLREAAVMDKIYSCSTCNLSASDAENSSIGLFWKHDPQILEPVTLKLFLEGVEEGTECTAVIESQSWMHRMETFPINRRGWGFQERILTPRVLHFGRGQLSWECRGHTACEKYPSGIPSPMMSVTPWAIKYQIDFGSLQSSFPCKWIDFISMWEVIVETYSPTRLTFPSDRLIAISGIAKRMAATGDSIYLAGLWRQGLETQLLWRTHTSVIDRKGLEGFSFSRPTEYRAPTWSWASIDSPVILVRSSPSDILVVQVVDVVLQYATEDTTGLVTGGWLDLKGTLRPASLKRDADEWLMVVQIATAEKPSRIFVLDVEETNPSAFDDDNAAQRIFFAPFASWSEKSLVGLILRFRIEVGKGTFERVGWVNVQISKDGMKPFLADMKKPQPDNLPCLRYEESKQVYRII